MGSPDFALPALKALLAAGHEIVAVYSQPPKPQGRGYQVQKTAIHEFAESVHLSAYTPKTLRNEEEQAKFKALKLDMAIVAAYGLILPKPILEAPKYGCLNIHGSLLPRWRGAAPIQRAIEAQDSETGITIMQMDEGLDTGDMIAKSTIQIGTQNAQELHDALSKMGASLLIDVLHKWGQHTPQKQPEEGITYASKLKKEEGFLNWNQDSDRLEAKIRAFTPWPGCFFTFRGEQIKVLKAESLPHRHNEKPGIVIDSNFAISCRQGALRPLILQRPGKKPVDLEAFLNGTKVQKGENVSL